MNLILSDRPFELSIAEDTVFKDLSSLKIANCVGCFGCWTRQPGKCVIRDDAVTVYPLIAESRNIIYVSRVKYGGYDTIMKTMLERAIPVQQAFIRIHNGETHHVQRDVKPKKAVIIAYGAKNDEEKQVFRALVDRNSRNMNFESHEVIFAEEENLSDVLKEQAAKWKK